MKKLLCILAAGMIAGCHPKKPATTQPMGRGQSPATQASIARASLSAKPLNPGDPLPDIQALIHLVVYQVDVPMDSISLNESFWSRADEKVLAPRTMALLHRNGLRIGSCAKTDWDHFRDILALQPNDVKKTSINGTHSPAVELELSKKIDFQDLWVYDDKNPFGVGRTYEACTNMVNLAFSFPPANPNAVRVALCPTVRSQRSKLEYSALNREFESPYTDVDQIFDLGLAIDLPEDRFLIVSPGEEAQRSWSVGGNFFVKKDKAELREQVLVIVPTLLPLDGSSTTIVGDIVKPPLQK